MFSKSFLSLLALSICSAKAATDCFTQVGDAYKVPANLSHPVSAGVVCRKSESSNCTVKAEGYVIETATTNLTGSNTYFEVLDAVRDNIDFPFNQTLAGSIFPGNFTIKPGNGGYALFTVEMRCFAGILGDCFSPRVEAGTYIEACTPTTLNDKFDGDYPTLDGTLRLVTTSPDDSTTVGMKTNPALEKPEGFKPTTTPTTPSATPSPSPSNSAAQLGLGVGAMGVIVAGTVAGLF